MLQPKKTKYRKHFRGTIKGKAQVGSSLSFGEYGLKTLVGGWLKARQIEAARKVIMHHTKRQAKLWIRVFPDKVYTGKSAGSRMGQGKGDPVGWVAVIKPGKILFELAGVEKDVAEEAIRKASTKLPFKTKFISRD